MKAIERLWLTEDKKKLVPEGHKDAAFLYAAPGDEIPDETAERFGLKNGGLKGGKPAEDKSPGPDEDKSGKKPDDKKGGGLRILGGKGKES